MSLGTAPAATDGRAIPPDARETRWHAPDGVVIRRIDYPPLAGAGPRGALLFAPGRGDCYEKYVETLGQWRARGWHVTALDWRGQGLSGRFGLDKLTGHVEDFAPWVNDFAAFAAQWRRERPGPHVCVAHSMGGHIVLRAAAEQRVGFDALVLVAPLLGVNPGWVPAGLLLRLAQAIAMLGDRRRPAWKQSELPLSVAGARMQLLTHDARRYADEAWWYEQRPELAMGPPSWGWIVAALASIRKLAARGILERVGAPVLVLGTRADRLVSWRAIRRAVARLPRGELVAFGAESRHEILREVDPVRDRAMKAIADFFDRVVPAKS